MNHIYILHVKFTLYQISTISFLIRTQHTSRYLLLPYVYFFSKTQNIISLITQISPLPIDSLTFQFLIEYHSTHYIYYYHGIHDIYDSHERNLSFSYYYLLLFFISLLSHNDHSIHNIHSLHLLPSPFFYESL